MNPYNTKIGVWLLLPFGETEVEEIKSYNLEAVKKKKIKPRHFDLKFGSLTTHSQIWGKMTKTTTMIKDD